MMSKNIPQLRFEGFTYDWEERKLIEVADYRNGKAHEKDISEYGDYIVVNSKFVSTNGLVKKYSDEMIAPLSKNEIAFVLSDVPNGRAIARTFLINEDNKYSLNQRIAGITPHADTNSYFLHSLMNRNHYFLRFDDGVSQTNLSKKEVEKWVEFYPSYEEQQKIGAFFKKIDDTIALHQRKLDLLKETKKGFLQKMFPKNGAKVPDIRFPGFTEDWEQRKLGEGIRFLNGKAYKQQELLDSGKYRVLRVGNFNTNDRWYYSDLELEENKYANKGDLLYLWATSFGPEIWNEETVIYHYHIWKLEFLTNELDKQYLYTWLLTDKEKIKQTTNGTTMVHVTKGIMEQRLFQFPKDIKEQQKIGSFFQQLDDTIALHQRKLDLLKEQKKGFLQKMFV